jgi:hypothetical protein
MTTSRLVAAIMHRAAMPSGVGTHELEGYTIKQVGKSIGRLVVAGRLLGVRDGRRARYFVLAADAARFAAARAAPASDPDDLIANWGPDEPTIYPPGYKHTVCPPSRMGEFVTNTHKDW